MYYQEASEASVTQVAERHAKGSVIGVGMGMRAKPESIVLVELAMAIWRACPPPG